MKDDEQSTIKALFGEIQPKKAVDRIKGSMLAASGLAILAPPKLVDRGNCTFAWTPQMLCHSFLT